MNLIQKNYNMYNNAGRFGDKAGCKMKKKEDISTVGYKHNYNEK